MPRVVAQNNNFDRNSARIEAQLQCEQDWFRAIAGRIRRFSMKQIVLAGGVMMGLVLAGCTGPNGTLSKSDAGLAVGAIAGGVIGNQFGKGKGKVVATALGAVIGGIVGSDIGRSLDDADRRAAGEAEYAALERGESGRATPWRNPDSGRYGTVVPGKPYKLGGGDRDCRDYTHTVYISGQPETLEGTACRNPDGTWTKVT